MTTAVTPTTEETVKAARVQWWSAPGSYWRTLREEREEQIFLVLTLLIGALVGALVVAFILITEQFWSAVYPAGGAAWRRLLVPVLGRWDGLFVVPVFSRRARKRCAANEGGAVGPRRKYFAWNGIR